MPGPDEGTRALPRAARVGAIAGVLAVVGGLSGVLIAAAAAPWFSWTGNALSDLGAPGRATAPLFNGSVIGAGALYLAFVWGTWNCGAAWSRPGRVGLAMLAGGAIFLMTVGIVPTGQTPHFLLSVGYFFLYPPGVFVFGAAERRAHKGLLEASFLLGGSALTFGVLQFTPVFTSQAIPELVLSASLGLWTMIVALWMRAGNLRPEAAALA